MRFLIEQNQIRVQEMRRTRVNNPIWLRRFPLGGNQFSDASERARLRWMKKTRGGGNWSPKRPDQKCYNSCLTDWSILVPQSCVTIILSLEKRFEMTIRLAMEASTNEPRCRDEGEQKKLQLFNRMMSWNGPSTILRCRRWWRPRSMRHSEFSNNFLITAVPGSIPC